MLSQIYWSHFSLSCNSNELRFIMFDKSNQAFDISIPRIVQRQISFFSVWFTVNIIRDLEAKKYHRQRAVLNHTNVFHQHF